MSAWAIATLVAKVVTMALTILDEQRSAAAESVSVNDTVRCTDCDEEAWVMRWGRIRIGQDLSGWYAQASMDGTPELLCRGCWHKRLGIDDYTAPRATADNHSG